MGPDPLVRDIPHLKICIPKTSPEKMIPIFVFFWSFSGSPDGKHLQKISSARRPPIPVIWHRNRANFGKPS